MLLLEYYLDTFKLPIFSENPAVFVGFLSSLFYLIKRGLIKYDVLEFVALKAFDHSLCSVEETEKLAGNDVRLFGFIIILLQMNNGVGDNHELLAELKRTLSRDEIDNIVSVLQTRGWLDEFLAYRVRSHWQHICQEAVACLMEVIQ